MSRIFRRLAFSPLIVNLAILAMMIGLYTRIRNQNIVDTRSVVVGFIGIFGGYLVSRAIQSRYWKLHQPEPRSDAELSTIVETMMGEARAAISRDYKNSERSRYDMPSPTCNHNQVSWNISFATSAR